MLKKGKEYFNKNVKQYRLLSKLCLVPMSIPVATLIYCGVKGEGMLMPTLIIGMVLFVATYVGYMSFRIKADILDEIATASSDDQ